MARTTADLLIERLAEWGVDTIFGLPGDGINGIFEALRTHQDKVRFIQVRHEESAAFAACGYAKYTGRLGVCLATSGPGGIHLLNGLHDAKMDNQPVLAITGHTFHDLKGTIRPCLNQLTAIAPYWTACAMPQRPYANRTMRTSSAMMPDLPPTNAITSTPRLLTRKKTHTAPRSTGTKGSPTLRTMRRNRRECLHTPTHIDCLY
jgi:2-succinyl-5-enolpyruvyl-6-hydroxy-3-cyclohexene-1-carboxylate synthase